ncbi:hypothetical protein C8J57DRAFT_1241242 [Mycena rebaudengoi]|nr:hypothetical protein C8J57DRAFT_1241242 [Mycena rebaudengoi]
MKFEPPELLRYFWEKRNEKGQGWRMDSEVCIWMTQTIAMQAFPSWQVDRREQVDSSGVFETLIVFAISSQAESLSVATHAKPGGSSKTQIGGGEADQDRSKQSWPTGSGNAVHTLGHRTVSATIQMTPSAVLELETVFITHMSEWKNKSSWEERAECESGIRRSKETSQLKVWESTFCPSAFRHRLNTTVNEFVPNIQGLNPGTILAVYT